MYGIKNLFNVFQDTRQRLNVFPQPCLVAFFDPISLFNLNF